MEDESLQAFSGGCGVSRWTSARTLAIFLFYLGRDACANIQLMPEGVEIARITLGCPSNQCPLTNPPTHTNYTGCVTGIWRWMDEYTGT